MKIINATVKVSRYSEENYQVRHILEWEGPVSGIAKLMGCNRQMADTYWPIEILDYDVLSGQAIIQRMDHGFYWWNRMKVAWFNLGQRHYHARCRLIAKLTYMGIGYREQGSIVEWRNLWAKKPDPDPQFQVPPLKELDYVSAKVEVECEPVKMRDILKLARSMGYKG